MCFPILFKRPDESEPYSSFFHSSVLFFFLLFVFFFFFRLILPIRPLGRSLPTSRAIIHSWATRIRRVGCIIPSPIPVLSPNTGKLFVGEVTTFSYQYHAYGIGTFMRPLGAHATGKSVCVLCNQKYIGMGLNKRKNTLPLLLHFRLLLRKRIKKKKKAI